MPRRQLRLKIGDLPVSGVYPVLENCLRPLEQHYFHTRKFHWIQQLTALNLRACPKSTAISPYAPQLAITQFKNIAACRTRAHVTFTMRKSPLLSYPGTGYPSPRVPRVPGLRFHPGENGSARAVLTIVAPSSNLITRVGLRVCGQTLCSIFTHFVRSKHTMCRYSSSTYQARNASACPLAGFCGCTNPTIPRDVDTDKDRDLDADYPVLLLVLGYPDTHGGGSGDPARALRDCSESCQVPGYGYPGMHINL
eukprot:1356642-Rhodomonas_salina.1